MKLSPCLVLLSTFTICKAQNKTQAKENAFDVNHGVVIEHVDSNIKKNIHLVHFTHSTGVIFPAAYGEKKFGRNKWWEGKTFFTPDSVLIKKIDKEISDQYGIAHMRFNSLNWDGTIERLKADSDFKELKIARKQRHIQEKREKKFWAKWKNNLIYDDRQYIGYISANGEKIIYVQFLNFREDPYGLKPMLANSWIEGWHGWFETNRRLLHFHIEKNLLTINEEF